ncbi:MAG: hypothetical protein ACW990_02315 [Promethearchaeota archaeon]|jgi:hypothetical protein
MVEFVVQDCWWEEATWPLIKMDEFNHRHLEDLRKRMFLIRNLNAGNVDIIKQYGILPPMTTGQAAGFEEPPMVPYDNNNWAIVWGSFGQFNPIEPGDKIVCFKDTTGHIDLYTNSGVVYWETVTLMPPVSINGQLSGGWLLYPNPNKYHDLDANAGRPSIGADGRWRVVNHPRGSGYCEGVFERYHIAEKAHRWYPRHTDPIEQVSPLKIGGSIRRRQDPKKWKVEVENLHISQRPWTHHYRTKTICAPGTCYPEHKCIRARRLNEYVFANSDPKDALIEDPQNPIGQNYSDDLLCDAFQDQVIHVCESQNNFVKDVNDAWIKNWVHFNTLYTWATTADPGYTYSYGNIVWVGEYDLDSKFEMDAFYVCTQTHVSMIGDEKMPGTAGGADYWHSPAFYPGYIKAHVPFAKLIDTENIQGDGAAYHDIDPAELWDCNGSAYELLLREIDPDSNNPHYDWYWDTAFPYIPWWLYTEHYEQFSGDPILYPIPRGCWRRIWKHSMGRPYHPTTKIPFLMWPGEWGYPPGFWEGRGSGGAGENDFRVMDHRFIVTQIQYSMSKAIDSTINLFRVVDVESLYATACAGREEEREKLLATHDHVIMRYTKKEVDGEWVYIPQPQYEITAQLINDMRIVLGQLNLLLQSEQIGTPNTHSSIQSILNERYDTSVGAFSAAKAECDATMAPEINQDASGYNCQVLWDVATSKWRVDTSFYKREHNTLIAIKEIPRSGDFSGGIEDLPIVNINAAHALYQLWYRGFQPSAISWSIIDSMQIGNSNRFVVPALDSGDIGDPTTFRVAYIELDFIQSYWYWDGGGDKWVHVEEWKLSNYSPWPPEEFFTNLDLAYTYSWSRGAYIWQNDDAGDSSGFYIDYNLYPESVFERDEINFIEVE